MKYTKKQIEESIAHWETILESMGSLEEVGADDILSMWKKKQDAEAAKSPAPDAKDAASAQEVKPKKFTSYAMGNDTHELYAGDWIFGMYMQKDSKFASYAIYRMSKLNAHKFKSLKNKSQTSTLKSFLTREAELIEKDERGDWTLDKFIEEMKRLTGPASMDRQPVLFTAGLNKTNYHYDRNARHRGKTTMTTQKTGHITYDLKHFKFDGSTFDVASGRSKQSLMSFGGASGKLPKQQADHSYEEIQEAIAHWTKVLESMDEIEEVDEAWGPAPKKESRKYQQDGYNFTVVVTAGKRRPSANECKMYGSDKWISYKSRRIFWDDDSTEKFSGRLYNDFGNIVIEPDWRGISQEEWMSEVGMTAEDLEKFLDAAEEVLKKSKKDF